MSDNDRFAIAARHHLGQGWLGTGIKIGKAFALRGAVRGQIGQIKRAQIGQLVKRHPLPSAKVLLPQPRVAVGRGQIGPKAACGLAAAQRRADQPRGIRRKPRPQGCKGGAIAAIGVNIAFARHPPLCHSRSMADQDQLCRGKDGHSRISPFAHPLFLL